METSQIWKSYGCGLPTGRIDGNLPWEICNYYINSPTSLPFQSHTHCSGLCSYHPSFQTLRRHSWYTCFLSLPRELSKLKYKSYFCCSSITTASDCLGILLSFAIKPFLTVSSSHSRLQILEFHANGTAKSLLMMTSSPLPKLFSKPGLPSPLLK